MKQVRVIKTNIHYFLPVNPTSHSRLIEIDDKLIIKSETNIEIEFKSVFSTKTPIDESFLIVEDFDGNRWKIFKRDIKIN